MPEPQEMVGGSPGRGAVVDADERDAVEAGAAVGDEREVALAGHVQEWMAIRQAPYDQSVDDGVGEDGRALLPVGVERGDELQHGVVARRALRDPAKELHGPGILEDVRERLAEEQPDAAGSPSSQA